MAGDKLLNIIVRAKDEASKQLQTIGSVVKDNFNKVAVAAGVAEAAVVGFSTVALKHFADTGEEIYNFSKTTGLAADSASALKMVADDMGLSIDAVGGAVKKMQINLNGMADDTKKADDALKPLGLKFNELKGMKPEDQFMKLGNAISSITDPAQRTAAAVSVFGKSGADLIPIFEDGKASLDDFKKAASDAGVLFDDLALNKAVSLDNAMDSLNTTMAGVSQQLAIALAPAITKLLEDLTPFIQSITDWMAKNPELTAQIIGVTAAVLGLLAILPAIVASFTALGAVLGFIAANPLVLVIGALVAFAGWMISLYNTNEEFKNKVNEVWNTIQSYITTAINFISQTVIAVIADLKAKWDEDWGGIRSTFEDIWNFLSTTGVEFVITLVQKIQEAFTPIVQFFQDNWDTITAIWNIAIAALGFVWDQFWATVKLVFTTAWDFVKMMIKTGLALMKGDWEGAWNAIKQFFIDTWGNIKQYVMDTVNNISKFLSDAWKSIQQGVEDFSKTVGKIWGDFWDGFGKVVEDAKKTVLGIIDSIIGSINSAISALQNLIGMKGSVGGSKGGGKAFARGGIPTTGSPNLVGEEGPELFVPDQRGTIIPTSKTGGGQIINVYVTGNTVLSDDGAEQIGDMIFNRLRLQTKI